MSTNKKKPSACSRCMYAVKNYFAIGNKFFFKDVSTCGRLPSSENKPFKEKDKCAFFMQDRLSRFGEDIHQDMLYISKQLSEIMWLLLDDDNTDE